MIEKILSDSRNKLNITQESVAEAIGVSRQAVQKWESGESTPDLNNILKLAEFYNLSLDYLVKGKDTRSVEELRTSDYLEPAFDEVTEWEAYYKQLMVEYDQCVDEGKDVSDLKDLFYNIAKLPNNLYKDKMSDVLFDLISSRPTVKGYKYNEPNNLDEIFNLGDNLNIELKKPNRKEIEDKVIGAYYGRICGCLLGKPVEGIRTPELNIILKGTKNYPLYRYINKSDITKEIADKVKFPIERRVALILHCHAVGGGRIAATGMSRPLCQFQTYGSDGCPPDKGKNIKKRR